jgi:toxin-antitoxin system PIN domain toxin
MLSEKRWRGDGRQQDTSRSRSGRSKAMGCDQELTSTIRLRFVISWIDVMLLPDVNILVYAYREDAPDHERFRAWLHESINSAEAYAISDLVCSGFLRIVTHPAVFDPPSPLGDALAFIEELRNQPNCVVIATGARHWQIFADLCRVSGVRGNLVPDAYLAALAIESGSEWITMDGDYARFPGLRWRRPLG